MVSTKTLLLKHYYRRQGNCRFRIDFCYSTLLRFHSILFFSRRKVWRFQACDSGNRAVRNSRDPVPLSSRWRPNLWPEAQRENRRGIALNLLTCPPPPPGEETRGRNHRKLADSWVTAFFLTIVISRCLFFWGGGGSR